jgi:CHAT domain-containing protein
MRQVLAWMMWVVLCCAAGMASGEQLPDPRLRKAQVAYDEARTLTAAGKYAEAVTQGEQALELREAVLGGQHPEVASCLDVLGDLLRRRGEFDRAESLLQRGLAIREAALGMGHTDVAASLNNLAVLYRVRGLYAQAEPLFQRALAIREAALGKDHPLFAESLHSLAVLYQVQGLYDRAEPLHQRALALREAALGRDHPDVAQSLNSLAALYQTQGDYGRAEALQQRALALREAALGQHHPDVAQSLNNLAVVYRKQGLYGRAEPLYQRALTLWEAALGKNHPSVADSLHNLALLYQSQGLYDRAEPLQQRAIAISEATLGKDHPALALSLNNLATLYLEQGMYARAEPLYQRAIAIQEAALGKDSSDIASGLNNLANLYQSQGRYGQAEPLYQRALAIREAALGKNHPSVADSLHNLASSYVDRELYGQAEPLYLRALAIQEGALGKHHPAFAATLNSLANLYAAQGKYARAESFYQRALAIREEAFGKHHPTIAKVLNEFALLRLAQHRLGEALPLFTRAFAVSEQRLRQEALGLSEARLASFLQLLRNDEERLYALLRAHPDDARVGRLALGAALLLKGRSIEETAHISRSVHQSLGAQELDTFERLRGLRTLLAQLSLQGPGSLPPAAYQQRLKELAEQGDALEATLARRSAPLRALTALPSPAAVVDRVAAAVPKGGALVEFIAYVDKPLVPRFHTPQAQTRGQLRYLAVVLQPNAALRALDLGPAAPIDAAAWRLRDALANRDATVQTHAQALYRLAFQPLLPLLGKTRRLFLSPDGQLALVPFAALHDGHQFLVEAFDFTYLTSGKDLLPRPQEKAPETSVVVLADPDFSASLPSPRLENASARKERAASVERFYSTLHVEPESRAWASHPLPGTRREAEALQRLLPQAELFLGPEATKERLLHLPTPGILHLATHGFFMQDAPVSPRSRGVGHFGGLGEDPSAPLPPDPLLRSGLLFAGAGRLQASTAGGPSPSAESALATALELAGLNLWGTQLVVLSACDTGRGDVKLGQGVYGLRRALVVAGAETVVMSLWKVDDEVTSTLMEAYYRHLLAGQGRAAALRTAMRGLRASKPHPHHWAPFIALGQDTPLRALVPQPPAPIH